MLFGLQCMGLCSDMRAGKSAELRHNIEVIAADWAVLKLVWEVL